jgi:uncharacterized membrane protein
MRINEFFAATALFALAAAPALAQSTKKAVTPLADGSEMGGGSSLLIIALVVAVGIGIYFITKNDNKPSSP